jgi:hypothetical protein
VIDNSGSVEKLGRRVDEVWEELQRLLAQRTLPLAGDPDP